jgi:predicted nucleic acid-binding protein
VRLILNASVVVKWLLHDEPMRSEAEQVKRDLRDRKILALLVPEYCLREVANALWVACRRKRINEQTAKEVWELFLSHIQLRILHVLPDPPLNDVLDFALRYNVPVYDSIYIVLAQQEGCPLLTADERLFQTVAPQLPFVQWLGDYGQESGQQQ